MKKNTALMLILLITAAGLISEETQSSLYNISFTLPHDLSIEKSISMYKADTVKEYSPLLNHESIILNDGSIITLSHLNDFPQSNVKEILTRIYTTKTVRSGDFLFLPYYYLEGGCGYAVNSFSALEYIESIKGNFRGMMFYAQTGQDFFPGIRSVVILTDGEKVLCFVSKSYNSETYLDRIENNRVTGFDENEQKKFSTYMKTVSTNSKEEQSGCIL